MAPRDRRSPMPRGRARPDGQRPDQHRATVDSNTLEEQCHPRKVFIGGLAHKTTTQHLRDHFGRFGSIVDAVVLRWPDGRSRGFGYVTFADSHAAAFVLKENHQLSGRDVDVKRAVPGTNKLFVGGLPQNTTANELREHFEKFGVVSDAVVMIDPATSRSRGFGFVCFLPGQEGATAVTSSLSHYENHRIRGKWIEVKSAAPPHKLAAKQDATPSHEELALAGALPGMGYPCSSPSQKEAREPGEGKGARHTLGSPRKVALPEVDVSDSPPPGLAAPMKLNDFDSSMMLNQSPWWGASPWPQPFVPGLAAHHFPAGGFSGPGFGASCFSDGAVPGVGPEYFGGAAQSGLSMDFQRNLEVFLRQSMLQKEKQGTPPRDPSVSSTTCSSATHGDNERTQVVL